MNTKPQFNVWDYIQKQNKKAAPYIARNVVRRGYNFTIGYDITEHLITTQECKK